METTAPGYLVRTEWNVRDSDGTVVFSLEPKVAGGSLATINYARSLGKPWIHISQEATPDPALELGRFIEGHQIVVLNVAGPRESGEPRIGAFVGAVLEGCLGRVDV
jgi:hypothetical protein